MTTIEQVSAALVAVPLPQATSFSSRTVLERHYALVTVTGDDGVTGIGFCYPGHKSGHLAVEAVTDLLAPVLIGRDAHHVQGLWDAMYQESLLHGRYGSVMRGLSALDIALWDRNARAADVSLHRYLGARTDRVQAYASGGYYLDGKGPDKLADEVSGYVARGFHAVKIKVGRLGLAEETLRIRAAREAIGPDVLLMLDANNAFRDLPTAIRAARAWEELDPYFLEEPFGPDDLTRHAQLAQATSIPIATGEIEYGHWRVKELLDQRSAVFLQHDAAVVGGITALRKVAALADAYGATMAPHWLHELHAHVVATLPHGSWVEYFPSNDVLNFRDIITAQPHVQDGYLTLSDAPGLGFDFDEAIVEKYLVRPWTTVTR
jgi:L-alanine-DL-glutamate epimerase-like enolase superfamily enzyme